jgi:hypothetical protein
MFPSGYTKYAAACKKRGGTPEVLLARYATRFKMAGQLARITLLDHSKDSEELYLHAMRVSFAYSALESLEEYLGKKVNIKEIEIAKQIRLCSAKTKDFFLSQSGTKLQNQLLKFLTSKNDSDIRHFCTAIRHSMFHGQFNPYSSGLNSKKGVLLMERIEKMLFSAMSETSEILFLNLVTENK